MTIVTKKKKKIIIINGNANGTLLEKSWHRHFLNIILWLYRQNILEAISKWYYTQTFNKFK